MNLLRSHGAALLAVAVSAGLMVLALRNVDFGKAAEVMAQARLAWLPVMAAVVAGDLLIRALRWRLLLAAAAPGAGVWSLFKLEVIGLGINNVVFMRLGEVARAFLAGRQLKIPLVTSLASIVVERVLDMTALLALFGAAAAAHPDIVPAHFAWIAWAGAGGLALALALLPAIERFLPQPGSGWVGRLWELVRKAAAGTLSLRSPGTAAACAALSLALWLLDCGLYWAGGRAIGLGEGWSYGRSVLTLASAAASSFFPAVPGSFGAFEAAVQFLLEKLGVESTRAFSYALFVHTVNYVIVTVAGIAFLLQTGVTLAEIKTLKSGDARR